jgi:hypothetical protein
MGDFDLEKTFAYFDSEGGFCECEILFNIDAGKEELDGELRD